MVAGGAPTAGSAAVGTGGPVLGGPGTRTAGAAQSDPARAAGPAQSDPARQQRLAHMVRVR